ncbi:hypothetical protein HJC23_010201 [Cyclotella cryptica]|uniref:Uncharacterized protein n=1 Tax=Cyclotella cryptica TaxID=29204 RepID=A0ABD3PIR3_9STRA|eukprot:CCRYP_014728-RA/>CCRYP_014728-RA protein AED:0.47 eAED:0.47 QI:0/-1/0/1/-1/1/1/0/184
MPTYPNSNCNNKAIADDSDVAMNGIDVVAASVDDFLVSDLSESHRSNGYGQGPHEIGLPGVGSWEDRFESYAPEATIIEDSNGKIVSILNPPRNHLSTDRRRVSYGKHSSSEVDVVPDESHVFRSSCISEMSVVTEDKHATGSKCSSSKKGSTSSRSFNGGIWGRLQQKSAVWEMESFDIRRRR